MTSSDAWLLGARLDDDHPPVTNGWMSVCRICGAYTDSPLGSHHIPSDLRLDRAEDWLDAKSPRHHDNVRVMVGA